MGSLILNSGNFTIPEEHIIYSFHPENYQAEGKWGSLRTAGI